MTTKGGKPGGGDATVGVREGEGESSWKVTDEAFYAVVKTHKRRSNEIYNSELTMTKIENQVKCKYRVYPQRIMLTFIAS